MSKKIAIVVPLSGKPYIATDITYEAKDIQRVVDGFFERLPYGLNPIVHPLFVMECPVWKSLQELINKSKRTQIDYFVNEDGRIKCSPNMAMIFKTKDFSSLHGKMVNKEMVDNCPDTIENLFGMVVMIVKQSLLNTHNIELPKKKLFEIVDSDSDNETTAG